MTIIFITQRNDGRQLGESLMSRVTETVMPKRRSGVSDKGVGGSRKAQGVQWSGTIAPCDLTPCQQILHRATRWVKLDGTIVVNGKLANGDEILKKLW
jgi:hypothetical protein